jgi:MraZ protein
MADLDGLYEVTLDGKGRFIIPSQLKKQLTEADGSGFTMNKGFSNCISLYPDAEWTKVKSKISNLNQFNQKAMTFQRLFLNGATHVDPDGSNRILVPKLMLEFLGMGKEDKDLIIQGMINKIEIWKADTYHKKMAADAENYESLGEEVYGAEFTNPLTGS